jgi:hypothetical protein
VRHDPLGEALDARYAGTLGREPWVGKITVTHIGKAGAATA